MAEEITIRRFEFSREETILKTTLKVMMALLLALLLSCGAVAEEVAVEASEEAAAAETSVAAEDAMASDFAVADSTGFAVTVNEKDEESRAGKRVFVLFPYDQQDSVLTDEDKKAEVFAALEILSAATKDTGVELYILTMMAEAENFIPVETVAAQMEVLLAGGQVNDRLDSGLKGIVEKVCAYVEELDGENYALILGDGLLLPSQYRSMEETVENANLQVLYRTIDGKQPEGTGDTGKAVETLLGEGVYADLPTEGAGLAAANELLEAMGWPTYALVEEGQDALFGRCATAGEKVYGCAKEYEAIAEADGTIYESGKAIPVSAQGLPEGMRLTCTVNGQTVALDENGSIPGEAVKEGDLSVVFSAVCEAPVKMTDSRPIDVVAKAAPVMTDEAKKRSVTVNKDSEGTYDLGSTDGLFVGGEIKDIAASVEEDGFEVWLSEEGNIILEGTATDDQTTVTVQLTARNQNGFTGTGSMTVTITNPVAGLSGMKLDDQSGLQAEYCADDPIEAVFALDAEGKAAAGNIEEGGWTIEAYYTLGDSEAVKLEGDCEKGWAFSATATDGQEELKVFLTVDGTIDEETAAFVKTLDVYPAEELIGSRWSQAVLQGEGAAAEYAINDTVSVTWKFDDASSLTEARGYENYTLTAALSGEGIEAQEDGTYFYHGEKVEFGGDIDGWKLQMPAHETTEVAITLTMTDADGKALDEKTEAVSLSVAKADLVHRLACMADGKDVWEEPNMMKLYLVAGGALVILIVLALAIAQLLKKKFRGCIVIRVETAAGASYTGNAVDLSVWGKKSVSFGTLLSGSALPPIAALTSPAIMNKLTFKADKKGVRAINKTGILQGGPAVQIIASGETVQLTLNDKSMTMWLTHQADAHASSDNTGAY